MGAGSEGGADPGGAAGWGGDGGLGGNTASGPLGRFGEPCGEEGARGCAGEASRFPLVCENGVWLSAGQCSVAERCATFGAALGTCQEAIPECLGHEPGEWVCADAERFRCGTDLLDEQEAETCSAACVEGACVACLPGLPAECAGNVVVTCSASGSWTETPCPDDAPHCSNGSCGQPASCAGLAKICGPLPPVGSGAESCCTSPLVSGGDFDRDNDPALPATISDFRLDRFEVTVGRFRRFKDAWDDGWRPSVGAGKHTHLNGGLGLSDSADPSGYESGWQESWTAAVDLTKAAQQLPLKGTWTQTASIRENQAMNLVSVIEGQAFCIWDGGFLPSGAEWSYAASGGDEQRLYPWGDEVPGANVEFAIYGCFLTSDCSSPEGIGSVGSVGVPGKFGQLDLAGNLAERTLGTSYAPMCTDCVNQPSLVADAQPDHAVRGGWYGGNKASITSASFELRDAGDREVRSGFRCARPP